jgi:hypothetical protein
MSKYSLPLKKKEAFYFLFMSELIEKKKIGLLA